MASYEQRIKVRSSFEQDAKKFLRFLQRVGSRYSRRVKLNYRYLKRGYFDLIIDGGSGGIDALFQELIINRGLYYYCCTLNQKGAVISNVVLPIYRQLIDERFENPQSRFLRKHVLGKHAQTDFIPTEIRNRPGSNFEILFRKRDLRLISTKDYLISLDALLTEFLLVQNGHSPGDRSPQFGSLLSKAAQKIVLGREARTTFSRVHELSRLSLHRLVQQKTEDEMNSLSLNLFGYFEYLDNFLESQNEKTVVFKGSRYKRIRYGDENIPDDIEKELIRDRGMNHSDYAADHPCGDCGVHKGQLHIDGCNIEQCPRCGGQMISYDCGLPQ